MKMAVVNDQHFGVRNDSIIFDEHIKNFYANVFFPHLDKHDIKIILDLGDTFDKRKDINFRTLESCRKYYFDEALKRDIKIHALVGNHTAYFKNSNELTILKTIANLYPNFTYYDSPKEVKFGKTTFLMLPWINSHNYQEATSAIEKTAAPVCLAHLELAGFNYQPGVVSDHGMNKKLFDNFHMVLSGHYHSKSDDKRIFYCGAQYDMSWSDYMDKKYFHILDSDTLELTAIENPNTIYVKMLYDDSSSDMLEAIKKDDFNRLKNKIVKVIVKNKLNSTAFDLFIEKVNFSGAYEVAVVDDTHHNLTLSKNDNILIQDTISIIKDAVNELPTNQDKAVLFKLMSDMYDEALSE